MQIVANHRSKEVDKQESTALELCFLQYGGTTCAVWGRLIKPSI
jgi:hypothetical protein